MEKLTQGPHLTDEELFRLALPATGEPEALPPHLLPCTACGRALQEWKEAVRVLGEEDEAVLARRSPEGWLAAEEATLAKIRKARLPVLRRRTIPGAIALAASLLLAVLLVTERQVREEGPLVIDETAELSPEDSADDALLREVALLARGEDAGSWNNLAPLPETEGLAEDEGEESL